MTSTTATPFLTQRGDELVPNPIAHGGWGPTLGGQVVGGLLARAIEAQVDDVDLHPARLTVEILRRVATEPVRVSATVVRAGGRMRSVDAAMIQDGHLVARASALKADLEALCGGDFAQVPVLPEGAAYAKRIEDAAKGDGELLIAHAYTRYLGDLSGGQILKKLLAKKPGLTPNELTFYDFPAYADLAALKNDYRNALDEAGKRAVKPQAIVDEGSVAFQLNTDISWAVQSAIEGAKVG